MAFVDVGGLTARIATNLSKGRKQQQSVEERRDKNRTVVGRERARDATNEGGKIRRKKNECLCVCEFKIE